MYFEKLYKEFSLLPEVEAIALGGSRAGDSYDEKSDYDLYIYCSSLPSEDDRKEIIQKYCSYYEIGNAFWELEDDCTLSNGIDIDILYRNLENFESDLSAVVEKCAARNGYTTAMWHNLLTSKILYDKNGSYARLKERFGVPYPDKLRENVVLRNLRLLSDNLPSYDKQIKKAVKRKDYVSVNHRVTAFLESYFDIIFAVNRLTHPGEKRMVEYAVKNAKILPDNFEGNIERLFDNLYINPDKALVAIDDMIKNLVAICRENIKCEAKKG